MELVFINYENINISIGDIEKHGERGETYWTAHPFIFSKISDLDNCDTESEACFKEKRNAISFLKAEFKKRIKIVEIQNEKRRTIGS